MTVTDEHSEAAPAETQTTTMQDFPAPTATGPDGAPPSTVANLTQQFGLRGYEDLPPTQVLAVHPTQLYEVTMGLVMFAILWRLRGHKHQMGWLFGAYCVLQGTERFIVEFFRMATSTKGMVPEFASAAVPVMSVRDGTVVPFAGRFTVEVGGVESKRKSAVA